MMPLSCFLVSPQVVLLVPAQKAVGARYSPGDPILSWTPMAPLVLSFLNTIGSRDIQVLYGERICR